MFTLGRKIDINYSTNRIIILVSFIVAIIGWLKTGELLSGLSIGGGTFLTWALAREVDPKHEYSAFLCVLFSLLNLFYYNKIELLVIFWIILSLRLVNKISGKEMTFIDVFSVLGMTIYLSFRDQNSIYLVPFIIMMLFIMSFKGKSLLVIISGLIAILAFIIESYNMKYLRMRNSNFSEPLNLFYLMIIIISFLIPYFLSKNEIKDDLGNPANIRRINGSQILFSIIVFLLYIFGHKSTNNMIIYLSVLLGIMIYWMGYKIMNNKFRGVDTNQ